MEAEQKSPETWTRRQQRAIRLLPNNLYFLDEAKWARTRGLSIPIEGLGNGNEAFEWLAEHRASHAKETGERYGVKLVGWPPTFSPELWWQVHLADILQEFQESSLRSLLPEPRLPAVFRGLTGEDLKDKMTDVLAEARCNLLYVFTRTLLENFELPDEMEWPIEGFLVTGDKRMLTAPQLALSEQGHSEELSEVKLVVSAFSPASTKHDWEELWPVVRPILQRHGWKQPPNRAESAAKASWHLVVLKRSTSLSWEKARRLLGSESKRFREMEPQHAIRSAIRLDKDLKPKKTFAEMMMDVETVEE